MVTDTTCCDLIDQASRYLKQQKAADGSYADVTVTESIEIQPGWKAGTKITFPAAGDEADGIIPGETLLCLSLRLDALRVGELCIGPA